MNGVSKILIVDDQPAGREVLEEALACADYEIAFAANGEEAIQQATHLVPDLILLDVMMPGIDGFEVCRRLRTDKLLAEVPIVMVTALDDSQSHIQGIEAGADDFISKPFNRGELRARVRTITRLNRYRKIHSERMRFAWVVEHAEDGYLMLNLSDGLLYANPQARNFLGVDQNAALSAEMKFIELARRQYLLEPEPLWKGWPQLLPQWVSRHRYMVRPESHRSDPYWLQVDVLEPISGSEPEHMLLRLRDVTRDIEMKSNLHNFHTAVRHKLRTPLGINMGSLELLSRHATELPPKTLAELARMSLEGANELKKRIEDVLSYASISSLNRSEKIFPLYMLGPLVVKLAESSGLQHGAVHIDFDSGVEMVHIALAPQAVEIILVELFENAIKFHPRHTPTIEMSITRVQNTQVKIRFRDDGVALSPEQLIQAFQPYYQAEKGFSGQVEGMGLGLSWVAMLVWETGGTCHLLNREDRPGVQVELVIPVKEEA